VAAKNGHLPQRTCVGCRKSDSPQNLLRYVIDEGVLVPDPRKRLPGRGAWLHNHAQCRKLALQRGGFARSFRSPVDVAWLAKLASDRGDN
jgi:predicted RNA-binding protein YlxR (DUF448 family)